ncbi:beta strand repeat-containing protein [Polluticaenibacter yanchengensis]|uniref:T9SS type A sorting domain-containing protein n=1 Tax=Polluticaenibacter yanchengensis TaxID=3014562 RepID=A0ABT4UMD4_9BACT|nr:T9SS type A sorting domain-containing protein [Chitinophagaceae bacterium LY-5]
MKKVLLQIKSWLFQQDLDEKNVYRKRHCLHSLFLSVILLSANAGFSQYNYFIGYNATTSTYTPATPVGFNNLPYVFNNAGTSQVTILGSGGSVKTAYVFGINGLSHYELGGNAHYVQVKLEGSALGDVTSIKLTGSSNSATSDNNAKVGVVFSADLDYVHPGSSGTAVLGAVTTTLAFPPAGNSSNTYGTSPYVERVIEIPGSAIPEGTKSIIIYRQIYYNSTTKTVFTSSGTGRTQLGLGQTIRLASVGLTIDAGCTPATLTSYTSTPISVCKDAPASQLAVVTTSTSPTYKWYYKSTPAATDSTEVSGATSATYTPQTDVAGTRHYYAIVSSTTNCAIKTAYTSVEVKAPPVATITSAATSTVFVDDVTTHTTQSGMSAYNWTVSGVLNTDYQVTAGAGTASVSIKWLTAGAKTVAVSYTGTNSCVSAQSTAVNVMVNAQTPTTTANPTALSFTNTIINQHSAAQTIAISGAFLTSANVAIAAPTGFEVSEDNSAFSSSLDLSHAPGTYSKTIYVRFSPLTAGAHAGNLVISGGGAPSVNVSLTGNALALPALTLTGNLPAAPYNLPKGNNGVAVYGFSLAAATNTATAAISDITVELSGTFVSSDFSNISLWASATNNFGGATKLKDVAGPGAGTIHFDALSESIATGVTRYYWVSLDVASGSVSGHTMTIGGLTASNITLSSGAVSGTSAAGNQYTIIVQSNATDRFRTNGSGNWSDVSTWEASADAGASWNAATLVPTATAAAIVVQENHTLTINNLTYPYEVVTYNAGAALKITGSYSPGANTGIQIKAGNYQTLIFDVNVTDATGYLSIGDQAVVIAGNLVVDNTGNGALLTSAANNSGNRIVQGNFTLNNGNIYVNRNSGSTRTLTVNGNFTLNDGNFWIKTVGTNSSGVLDVKGHFVVSALATIGRNTNVGSSTINLTGTTNQNLSLAPGAYFTTNSTAFVVNKSASLVQLSGNTDIPVVTLTNGQIELGNYNLVVNSLAGTTETKYIVTNGAGALTINNIGNAEVLFPVGPSSTRYLPATITNAGVADNFSVRVQPDFTGYVLADPTKAVKAIWHISEAVEGGSNVTVKFKYTNTEENEGENFISGGVHVIAHFDVDNQTWESFYATITKEGNYEVATVSGINAFSPFGSGLAGAFDNGTPLPVVIKAFNGNKISQNNVLNWELTTEVNVNRYVIERSLNGIEYVTAGTLNYNASKSGKYSFEDAGINTLAYYRLKIINNDGSFTYSKVIMLNGADIKDLAITPNPVRNNLFVTFDRLKSNSKLIITSNNGQVVKQVVLAVNSVQATIDASVLSAGTYTISIIDGANRQTKRFVKL